MDTDLSSEEPQGQGESSSSLSPETIPHASPRYIRSTQEWAEEIETFFDDVLLRDAAIDQRLNLHLHPEEIYDAASKEMSEQIADYLDGTRTAAQPRRNGLVEQASSALDEVLESKPVQMAQWMRDNLIMHF